MEELLKHPLLATPDVALSVDALLTYASVKIPLFSWLGLKDKALPLLTDVFARADAAYNGKYPYVQRYLHLLHHTMNMYGKEDVEKMGPLIDKFSEYLVTAKKDFNVQAYMYAETIYLAHSIRYRLFKRQPAMVLPLAAQLRELIKKHPGNMQSQHLYCNVMEAYALLDLREFEKALKVVNLVLNEKYTVRTDLQMDAEWLNMIVHIELGNYNLIKSLGRRNAASAKAMKEHAPYATGLTRHFNLMSAAYKAGDKRKIKSYAADFLKFAQTAPADRLEYLKNWLEQILEKGN
jgi:hypothetical protein